MKSLIVGATGTLGKAVAAELGQRHQIIAAGRNSGDLRMDITDAEFIRAAYDDVGPVDAVVSAAGKVKFAPFDEMRAFASTP